MPYVGLHGFSCLPVRIRSNSSILNVNMNFLKTEQKIYICLFIRISNLTEELTVIMSSAPVMNTQEHHSKDIYLF
jgi:hypothetical protein